MGKENYTDIDNEVKTDIVNEGRSNIDNEVRIHPAFIRFVLTRPWMRDVSYYKAIRAYEKRERMNLLFENDNGSWHQTIKKLYKGLRDRTNAIQIPYGLTDYDITVILKEPLFADAKNVKSVFAAADRIVPSVMDYDKYETDNVSEVREMVIRDIFLSLNGGDKDWKSEFCLKMEEKYKSWMKEI